MNRNLTATDLPDYASLCSGADWDFTLQNYIESRGSFELAIAFCSVFWPTFIERRGCIVRADGFDEKNFESWWERTQGDRMAIEWALNHLHVGDLVPGESATVTRAAKAHLGSKIAEMWSACVATQFPGRAFVVRCQGVDAADTSDVAVYLYQDEAGADRT